MFGKKSKKEEPSVDSSSQADIAFLLLIFWLVTTTIASDSGLAVMLPPKVEDIQEIKLKPRNIFKIVLSSGDKMLVEDEPMENVALLKDEVKKFVSNNGRNPKMSESPKKAVVSLKADRGTSYKLYITVLDELKTAYNELRAEHLGITLEKYNSLTKKKPNEEQMLKDARKAYPYQVSDAEPTDVSGLR